jgi:small GTP-binding protein
MAQKKIVIVGDAAVGKTSLSNALCKIPFEKRYIPTVGVDIQCDERCVLWDTAGQEHCQPENPAIVEARSRCDFYIIMFNSNSFMGKQIMPWLKQMEESSTPVDNAKILLVGNEISNLPRGHSSKIGNKPHGRSVFFVNMKTGDGMKQLENVLFA